MNGQKNIQNIRNITQPKKPNKNKHLALYPILLQPNVKKSNNIKDLQIPFNNSVLQCSVNVLLEH